MRAGFFNLLIVQSSPEKEIVARGFILVAARGFVVYHCEGALEGKRKMRGENGKIEGTKRKGRERMKMLLWFRSYFTL